MVTFTQWAPPLGLNLLKEKLLSTQDVYCMKKEEKHWTTYLPNVHLQGHCGLLHF